MILVGVKNMSRANTNVTLVLLLACLVLMLLWRFPDTNDVHARQVIGRLKGNAASNVYGGCERAGNEANVIHVWVVYGTRPELIKLAPVVWALKKEKRICTCVVNTGQHQSLTANLTEYFNIADDVRLELNRTPSLNSLFLSVQRGLADLLELHGRTTVVVQGDTTTAVAAGWASFLHGDSHVVHVEAGLRTRSLRSPYPEEANRRILGQLCTLCFAPTRRSLTNLVNENIDRDRLFLTGNTVIDALHYTLSNPLSNELFLTDMETEQPLAVTRTMLESKRRVILVTTHRRERFGKPMRNLFDVVVETALKHRDCVFLLPLHPNPEIRRAIHGRRMFNMSNVIFLKPPMYPHFISLLRVVSIVISDSGGIQEEASSLGIPLLIVREHSERMEAVQNGNALLVGDQGKELRIQLKSLIEKDDVFTAMAKKTKLFGNGTAATAIASTLVTKFQLLSRPPAIKRDFVPTANSDVTFGLDPLDEDFGRREIKGSVTVIIQVFQKDSRLLDRQLQALVSSTEKPYEIIVLQNENRSHFESTLSKYPSVKHIHSVNKNLKYHGRFLLPLMVETEFCAIVDDDSIPGSEFLSQAVKYVHKLNGMVGSSGRRIGSSFGYLCNNKRVGRTQQVCDFNKVQWKFLSKEFFEVDFVGHWWVFRTEWAHLMWSLPPPTFATGEDISFAAVLSIFRGIRCYVLKPGSPKDIPELPIPKHLKSITQAAQTTLAKEREMRDKLIEYWLRQGWETVLSRTQQSHHEKSGRTVWNKDERPEKFLELP